MANLVMSSTPTPIIICIYLPTCIILFPATLVHTPTYYIVTLPHTIFTYFYDKTCGGVWYLKSCSGPHIFNQETKQSGPGNRALQRRGKGGAREKEREREREGEIHNGYSLLLSHRRKLIGTHSHKISIGA